jgi:hypothetical protein
LATKGFRQGLLCGEQHYQFVRLTAGGRRIRTIGLFP